MVWVLASVDFLVAFGCFWSLKSDLESDSPEWSLGTVSLAWAVFALHSGLCIWVSITDSLDIAVLERSSAIFLGGFFVGTGTVFFFGGVATFASLERMSGQDRTELITDGFYLFSRNPQLVGWLLQLVGIAVVGQSVVAFLLTVLAGVFVHAYVIRLEEPFLTEVFGDKYLAYCQKTARYLGRRTQ